MTGFVTYNSLEEETGIGYETLRRWGKAGLFGPRVRFGTKNFVFKRSEALKGIEKARAADGRRKLTDAQVIELCARYEDGERLRDLADEFGIHHTHAWRIVNGKARVDVDA